MNTPRMYAFALVAALAVACRGVAVAADGFVDVLDSPSQISPLASRSLLQAVVKAGSRLIAVGQRGHIVVSTDRGATWKQSPVPVSSDLTSVYFVDAREGWAVGHDGVILHSRDGGDTWELQLTGRVANELLVWALKRTVAAEPSSDEAKKLLTEATRYQEQGADKPFLDVWFADSRNGYAVGAYNLIFRTSDGGKHWEPWFDRTENPKFFNLYAIRPASGALYIAGEGGLVLKLDPVAQRFRAVATPYEGSFFGVADAGASALLFGLRGNVYASNDGGATWSKVDAGLAASVVAATRSAQGAVLLADAGGRISASTDGGRTFTKVTLKQSVPVTGLVEIGEARLVLVGPRGATVAEIASH
jgi:photosystem II stability/assembly factor-like uncharacterized protein